MTEELTKTIRERIAAGQTKKEIIKDLLAIGHTQEVVEAAYTLASRDLTAGADAPLRFSARALFTGGWEFVKKHPRLTAVSAIPLVAEVFLTFARNSEFASDSMVTIGLLALSVVAGLLYICTLMLVLMRLTHSETPLTATTALNFVRRHFLPLCLIYFLSGLLTLGGLTLFLLPGLAVMISIGFAQYVYLYEGKGGLSALLQSAALVRGRFWHVAHKVSAFIFLSFLPMFTLVVLYGLLSAFYESTATDLISEVLLQITTAVLTVINLQAMNSIYLKLKANDLNLSGKLLPKARYIFMMVVGVGMLALIAMAYTFTDSINSFFEEIPALETNSGVQSQVSATALLAKRYFLDNNQSYSGVCEPLKNSVTESEDVACNDSEEAWALTATDPDGTLWCADKNTLAKKIQVPLESRTECFPK